MNHLSDLLDIDEIKAIIDAVFTQPDQPETTPLLTELQAENPATVGIAYKHLFKIWAIRAYDQVHPREMIPVDIRQHMNSLGANQYEEMEIVFDQLERECLKYHHEGHCSRTLYRRILSLARVEHQLRYTDTKTADQLVRIFAGHDKYDQTDIDDLGYLHEILTKREYDPTTKIAIRPEYTLTTTAKQPFRFSCDYLTEDTLGTVTTKQDKTISKRMWNKLILQVIFFDLAQKHTTKRNALIIEDNPTPNTIKIYYARYNDHIKIPVEKITSTEKYSKVLHKVDNTTIR